MFDCNNYNLELKRFSLSEKKFQKIGIFDDGGG